MRVCRVLHDYDTDTIGRLSLQEGETVWVLTEHESGWFDGVKDGQRGWFPSNFCSEVKEQPLDFEDSDGMAYYGWSEDANGQWCNKLTGEILPAPLKINVSMLRRGSSASTSSIKSVPANWRDVRRLVTSQIGDLKDADVDRQVEYLDMIVGTVHNMLIASNTFSRTSTILKSSKILKTHHKHIVRSLAALSKSRSLPQLTSDQHNSLNELLLAVRYFTELADQMNVPLQLEQQLSHVKSAERLAMSPYTPTLSSTSETPSLTVHQEIAAQLEPSTQDIIETLMQMKESVKSKQFKPVDVIDLTKSVVTKIGQLLSLLDELDASAFDNQPPLELVVSPEMHPDVMKAFGQFTDKKELMYENVFGLVNTTTEATESFAPSDAARRLVKAINLIHQTLLSLISCVKQRIPVWQYQEAESSRLRKVKSAESPEAETTQHRRTQSMNVHKVSKKPSLMISTIPQGSVIQEVSPKRSSIFNRFSLHSPLSMSMPNASMFERKSSPNLRRVTVIGSDENKASQVLGESVSLHGQRHSLQALKDYPFLGSDINDKDVQYTKAGGLKGATLVTTIVLLTDHRSVDIQFLQHFLLTYRTFAKSTDVLRLLFDRFNMPCPSELNEVEATIWRNQKQKPIRLRVYNVIKTWLDSFFYTDHDLEAMPMLSEFCRNTLQHILPSATEKLVRLIEKRLRQKMDDMKLRRKTFINPIVSGTDGECPKPVLPSRWSSNMTVLDFDPLELARQLTLHDFQLYYNIQPIEFLQNAWSDKENDYAPNIKKLIQVSNKVTAWVADTILSQDSAKERAAMVKQFVLIADKCRQLNNFNTLMSILAALASSPVHRLKRSFDLLSSKTQTLLTELRELMSPNANFANYRQQLKVLSPPCFPFLGRYLTDLTFIEDGNPNMLKSHPHLINMDKRIKAAQKIIEIQQYQQSQYKLQVVTDIQNWLEHHLQHSESDNDLLYDRSMFLEPRERDDETMARILSETGLL